MKKLRQVHFYLGVLFAPSILFFAFTGAYQTFRWNETGALGALTPIASQMASIHKNAALENGEPPRRRENTRKNVAPQAGFNREPQGDQVARRPSGLPLKIYIFLMSLGLITSTLTGVTLSFKYQRERRILWGLLLVGTLLPLVLLRI